MQPLDRRAPAVAVTRLPNVQHASAWPNDTTLAFSNNRSARTLGDSVSGTTADVVNPISQVSPRPLRNAGWGELDAAISPDGRWSDHLQSGGPRDRYQCPKVTPGTTFALNVSPHVGALAYAMLTGEPPLVASLRRNAHVLCMLLAPLDVSPEVAELQTQRYRQMTPAEKLARADAIWELAWDAVTTGVRLRDPDLDDATVTRTARELFRRAAD